MVSTPRSGDAGLSSIIAVVMLLAMVVLCGSIISLLVLQSVQDAAPTTLHAQFQASADKDRLYLTGGDVLPIADLTFYDTSGNVISDVKYSNGDSSDGESSGVWTPGEYITIPGGNLGSIVARDARGNSVLVYRAGSSTSIPTGDMVPDWWSNDTIPTWTPGGDSGGTELPPVPGKKPAKGETVNVQYLNFGDVGLVKKQEVVEENTYNYSLPPSGEISVGVTMKPHQGNYDSSWLNVTVFNSSNIQIFNERKPIPMNGNDRDPLQISDLKIGYTCYVTVERYPSSGGEEIFTIVVKMT